MKKHRNSPITTLEDAEKVLGKINIKNDFVFSRIFEEEAVLEETLNAILPEQNAPLSFVQKQKWMKDGRLDMSATLDVYGMDENGQQYNLEMQNKKEDNLYIRASSYSAKMMEQGMNHFQNLAKHQKIKFKYQHITPRYIFFFCNFDIEKQGYPIYFEEKGYTSMEDLPKRKNGDYQIFINIKAYQKARDPQLNALLCYFSTGKTNSDLTKKIHKSVQNLLQKEDWRQHFMTLAMKRDLWIEEIQLELDQERAKAEEARLREEQARLRAEEEARLREESFRLERENATTQTILSLRSILTKEDIAHHLNLPLEKVESILKENL